MKVLVFPNRMQGNPYFGNFVSGLVTAGIQDVRLSRVLRLRSNFDVAHFHHPEHAVTQGSWLKSIVLVAAVLAVLFYAKITSRPIIWMVHDVKPPSIRRKHFLKVFMGVFTACTDAYVFLNGSSQRHFYVNWPKEERKPFRIAPHSRFHTTPHDGTAKNDLRTRHGIKEDQILVSFLGEIKEYKGLECATLFPKMTKSGTTVRIAICGEENEVIPLSYLQTILSGLQDPSYIRIDTRLTDEELGLWIRSSDAVVLSYKMGSNSGMALNVLSNQGKVIASNLPMFQELAEHCGPTWIRCVDLGQAAAVEVAVEDLEQWRKQELDFDRLERALLTGDPAENGRNLLKFYRELCSRK